MRALLIANRGEIALRIMRTARRQGLRTVAVYSEADRNARHVREADTAVCIGGAAPRESYLGINAIIAAAKRSGADAVHPGYGFLAENADFAQAVLDAGLTWIGPSPTAIRLMGDKARAKAIARAAGLPTIPGAEPDDQSNAGLAAAARAVGLPLMIKAAAGGGGRGMRLVRTEADLAAALDAARSEAAHAFGDGALLLERALEGARHIEVQVFADTHGHVVHLGERDCSVQRRHQKLIEESPSPAVTPALRDRMGAAAIALAEAVNYVGAGTVEFLLDADGQFYFMEMNTRLQVEHPVTEMVTSLDLVAWQLRVAAGEPLRLRQQDVRLSGHAIEARLCAEDPERNFLPQAGRIVLWTPDADVRTDHALESGSEITPHYDSMIAKVIAHGATRDEARERLARALDQTIALGLASNKAFLAAVLRHEEFAQSGATTDFLSRFKPAEPGTPDSATLAVAAALFAARAPYGEWTSWSNNPARVASLRLAGTDVALQYAAGRYQALISGATVNVCVASLHPPHARVAIDDGPDETITFVADGDTIHFARGGASWSIVDSTHAPPERRASAASDGRLIAPMNGRVVAVNASPGDTIEADRAIVVLEAMKMEHGLSVPVTMRVRVVHVTSGQQVAPGHLLVELEAVP